MSHDLIQRREIFLLASNGRDAHLSNNFHYMSVIKLFTIQTWKVL